MIDTLTEEVLEQKKEKIIELNTGKNGWKEKYEDLVGYLAEKIGVVQDEIEVKSKLELYFKAFDEVEKQKDLKQRESEKRKKDYLKHGRELEEQKKKLDKLHQQFAIDIQVLEDRYQQRYLRIEKSLNSDITEAQKIEKQIPLSMVERIKQFFLQN